MNKYCAIVLTSAALAFTASNANAASTLNISSVSVTHSGAPTADLNVGGSQIINNVKATPQTVVGMWDSVAVNLFTYCVDIYQTSSTGTFDVVSLSSYLNNATKFDRIAALIDANSTAGSALHDAAMQLAIWELINETQPTLNISSNHFIANDLSVASLAADTNTLLAYAVSNAGTASANLQLYVARSDTKQDLLFWTRTAVPEPSSWAMMILGLGAVGAALRHGRRTTAVRFA